MIGGRRVSRVRTRRGGWLRHRLLDVCDLRMEEVWGRLSRWVLLRLVQVWLLRPRRGKFRHLVRRAVRMSSLRTRRFSIVHGLRRVKLNRRCKNK